MASARSSAAARSTCTMSPSDTANPRPVQLVQQRLPVDVQAGERDQVRQCSVDGRPPRRPAPAPAPAADEVDQRSLERVHAAASPGAPPAPSPPRGSRDVLEPGRRGPPPARRPELGAATVPRRIARMPTPAGPPHLCALALRTTSRPDCEATHGLRGVHEQGHAASRRAPPPRHRLQRSHLVVGGLEAGQRGIQRSASAYASARPGRSTRTTVTRRPRFVARPRAARPSVDRAHHRCRPTRRRASRAPGCRVQRLGPRG